MGILGRILMLMETEGTDLLVQKPMIMILMEQTMGIDMALLQFKRHRHQYRERGILAQEQKVLQKGR
jgi:hypothetical protein